MIKTDVTYIFAMSKLVDTEWDEEPVECYVELFGKNHEHSRVSAIEPGYRTKSFNNEFVEWMLLRGQARIKDSLNNRYNVWVGPWCGAYLDPVQYTVVSNEEISQIVTKLQSQSLTVKQNIRLLFNVENSMLDYYINIFNKHLADWKNLLVFTYNLDHSIDNITGWKKQNNNFINISTKEFYFQ